MLVQLTADTAFDGQPAWSPDGAKIAFASTRNGTTPQIYVMKANGDSVVRLTHSIRFDVQPAWSPDGTKIAFATNRDSNDEIYVMNADGTNAVNVTNHPAADGLARIAKTESGPVAGNAGSSPAPGGTDQPMAGGMGGMTSK